MSHGDGGKGDAPRKQQDQKAYEEGWDRIFKKKPKEKLIEEEPLKDDENDD
jgi:hypothetical protein